MHRLPLYIWVFFFALVSCGPEDPRTFDNPVDPDGKKTVPVNPVDTSGVGRDGKGVCLTSTCAPAAKSSFSFGPAILLNPAGCSGTKRMQLFAVGTKVFAFLLTNCGAGMQVYAVPMNGAGVSAGTPVQITSGCGVAMATTLEDMGVGQSDGGFAVAYSCKATTSAYESNYLFRTKVVGPDLSLLATTDIGTYQYAQGPIRVAWNATAAAYGIGTATRFLRVNGAGEVLGGAVSLTSNYAGYVLVRDGVWVMIQHANNSSNGPESTFCTRINASGAKLCDQVYSYDAMKGAPATDKAIYARRYGGVSVGSFDWNTCQTLGDTTSVSTANGTSSYSQAATMMVLPSLTDGKGGFLYASLSGVYLASFGLSGAFKIEAESPVGLNTTTSQSAWPSEMSSVRVGDRLLVGYVQNASPELHVTDLTQAQ